MDPFKFWDTLKTGTATVVLIGAAGILAIGIALTLHGDLSWTAFGMGTWTVLTGVVTALRGRFAALKTHAEARNARATAERVERFLMNGRGAGMEEGAR